MPEAQGLSLCLSPPDGRRRFPGSRSSPGIQTELASEQPHSRRMC
jgi:hypothetical protein